ncbi:hypothetical protein ACQR3P_28910 [Rhodococcus sp. IEGM1300]
MNIYHFLYEDDAVTFSKMIPESTLEAAASEFKSALNTAFNGLYDDVDAETYLQSVLENYGPTPINVKIDKSDEVVTCVLREDILTLPTIEEGHIGIFSGDAAHLMFSDMSTELYSIRRGDCEQDPTYKQIIPYVILRHEGKYFAYKRLSGSGEQRLVNQISIGVGGHMNLCPVDADLEAFERVVTTEAMRELHEELIIGKDVTVYFDPKSMHVLNDDVNKVGQVHIGIVYVVDLDSDDIRVRETESLEGGFVTEEYLMENIDKLESWTKIFLENKRGATV